jgi:CubicO group peptidase (beta-lactamase class C family)
MTIEVHGYCDPRFERLKAAFVANFEADLELGASVAATWHGEPVVDLWAGWADVAKTRPWDRDTVVGVFSTTKMMVTLCVLMLVDRGLIDLDAPMATYWPEFAAGGKERVLVRDFFRRARPASRRRYWCRCSWTGRRRRRALRPSRIGSGVSGG